MDLVFAPSQIESWPIARLRPYARNAKMHGDDQVAKIAASMAKFGWTVPCMVADDGELIAGHGRVLAATMLGLTEVPVIRLSHLDEAERGPTGSRTTSFCGCRPWCKSLLPFCACDRLQTSVRPLGAAMSEAAGRYGDPRIGSKSDCRAL